MAISTRASDKGRSGGFQMAGNVGGTGIMGAPMAGHLLAAGYPVTVHNRTKAKAQPLLDQGAKWADDAAARAANDTELA